MTGRTISHYEILEKLGEGGMGVVYKARDTNLNRFVALKLLPSEKVGDEDRLRRFTQEARTASALNHPNIITIHDIATDDGLRFIVMEFVSGKTLDQLIPRKGMRLAEVLKISVQIAEALAAAAAAGVIHRDIKPGNVMVTDHGHVKVLDFGLAKMSDRAASSEQATATYLGEAGLPQTREGSVIGTVSYMSPEQAEGKPLDPRSDIFSFGAVLYEMITGQRAFRGETSMSTISAILRDDPQPVGEVAGDVPRDLERIIARCLRKDPERRFQTMADIRVALLELKDESESGRLPLTNAPPAVNSKPRGIFAAAVILLAVAVLFAVRSRQPAPVREVEQRVTPFTSYPGRQWTPAFSPDANQIAFSWTGPEGSVMHLYVKVIGTESPLQLTSGPDSDAFPQWSPDGRSIAFLRLLITGESGVYQISPLGGTARRIAQFAAVGRLAWSADGKFLLVAGRQTPDQTSRIFLISPDTGQTTALALEKSRPASNPVVSPDGKHLAFTMGTGEVSVQLHVVDLNGQMEIQGTPRLLKSEAALNSPWGWTADSREILFSTGGIGTPSRLMRVAADGTTPPRGVVGTSDGVISAALSAKGDRLVYARAYSDENVWSFPVTGPGKIGTPSVLLASTRGEWIRPNCWSPDARRLLFESDRSGRRTIWVSNADASQPAPLIPGDAFTTGSPAWSPDGKWVAFDSRRDGNPEIYVVSSDGGAARRVTNHASVDAVPSWSPDGKWIFFSSDRTGRFEIFKIPADGGDSVQVTRNGGWGNQFSADGKYLYYSRSRGPGSGVVGTLPAFALLRMPIDGGDETQIMDGVRERSWAVAATGVWYLWGDSRSHGELRFFDTKTGKSSSLTSISKAMSTGLTLSPDGRQLLFNQVDQQNSEILLVENFR